MAGRADVSDLCVAVLMTHRPLSEFRERTGEPVSGLEIGKLNGFHDHASQESVSWKGCGWQPLNHPLTARVYVADGAILMLHRLQRVLSSSCILPLRCLIYIASRCPESTS